MSRARQDRAIDVTGERRGRLVAIRRMETGAGPSFWEFRCDCGTICVRPLRPFRAGDSSSCGCLKKELWEGVVQQKRLPSQEAAYKRLIDGYKRGARNRGYAWELTGEEARSLFSANCIYCGIEPKQVYPPAGAKRPLNGHVLYNGIDRLNNDGGYVKGNVAACCGTCNRAKQAMSQDEFLGWIRQVANHNRALLNPVDGTDS